MAITIDFYLFPGSRFSDSELERQFDLASRIFLERCEVRLRAGRTVRTPGRSVPAPRPRPSGRLPGQAAQQGVGGRPPQRRETAEGLSAPPPEPWLGWDGAIDMTVAATGTSEDERRLIRGVCRRYHPPRNHILAFYVPLLRTNEELVRDGKAYTFTYHAELAPACAIPNTAHEDTLAHEIGHLLLNPGRHENDRNNLMHSSDEPRTGHALTDHQVFLINDTVRGHFGPQGSLSSRRCS